MLEVLKCISDFYSSLISTFSIGISHPCPWLQLLFLEQRFLKSLFLPLSSLNFNSLTGHTSSLGYLKGTYTPHPRIEPTVFCSNFAIFFQCVLVGWSHIRILTMYSQNGWWWAFELSLRHYSLKEKFINVPFDKVPHFYQRASPCNCRLCWAVGLEGILFAHYPLLQS